MTEKYQKEFTVDPVVDVYAEAVRSEELALLNSDNKDYYRQRIQQIQRMFQYYQYCKAVNLGTDPKEAAELIYGAFLPRNGIPKYLPGLDITHETKVQMTAVFTIYGKTVSCGVDNLIGFNPVALAAVLTMVGIKPEEAGQCIHAIREQTLDYINACGTLRNMYTGPHFKLPITHLQQQLSVKFVQHIPLVMEWYNPVFPVDVPVVY